MAMVDDQALESWFFQEIFPLDGMLTRFIRRNWRNEADIADLRQDVYAKVYAAAREQLPLQAKPMLLTTARHHMIDCARRAKIVSIEQVSDLEASRFVDDGPPADRTLLAREQLRRVEAGLKLLPARCREVVVLRRIEGLSIREVATRLNLTDGTVKQQTVYGMRALIDFMLGGSGKIRRPTPARRKAEADAQ